MADITPEELAETRSADRPVFSKEAWLFAFVAVALPNILFVLASFFVIPIRTFAIPAYFLFAILAPRLPAALIAVGAFVILLIDILLVVSSLFDLAPTLALQSVVYMVKLDVFSSTTYLVAGIAFILTTSLYIWLLISNRTAFRNVSLIPAILGCFLLMAGEFAFNIIPKGKLSHLSASEDYFESAVTKANLLPTPASASTPQQDVLIVMLEGFGAFESQQLRDVFWDQLKTADITERYEISDGTSAYHGSTTAAEARELCGEWADFTSYLTADRYECLPAKFADLGYQTTAFHAFTHQFFDRDIWLPRIGFQDLVFMENLAKRNDMPKRFCGLTFKGFCDADLAKIVKAHLLEDLGKPKFTYWLTLNTHVPIAPEEAPDRLDCSGETPFIDPSLCRMSAMWLDVIEDVKQMALHPDLADTHIILVGDHHPPIWNRAAKALFKPGEVGWISLKPHNRTTAPG